MYGRPFKLKVWLGIVASLPFGALMLLVFSKAGRKILWARRKEFNFQPQSFASSVWLVLGTLTNDGEKYIFFYAFLGN